MSDRFKELKNNAQQTSQVIGAQLQSIESSLLGAFISILISAFISEEFGLLIFWIPASFLLMWLLLMHSLFKSLIPRSLIPLIRRRNRTEQNGNVQIAELSSDVDKFLITTWFKNSTPLFKSIGVLFFVSFLSLVLYEIDLIGEDITFCITIPLISSLLFMSLPILIKTVIANLEKSESKLDFTKIGCLGLFLISVIALVYTLVLLVFPILSFVILHPIYIGGLPSILSILVVIIFQVIVALLFMNYFSASLVRKEMSIALFNLSNIQSHIEDLLSKQNISQNISDEIYQELRREYTKAKRYNMTTDDTLLVNYYSIIPNPTYLSELDKQ